jgi:hypothetical protein
VQSSRDTQYLDPHATLVPPFAIDLKDVQPAAGAGEAERPPCELFRGCGPACEF